MASAVVIDFSNFFDDSFVSFYFADLAIHIDNYETKTKGTRKQNGAKTLHGFIFQYERSEFKTGIFELDLTNFEDVWSDLYYNFFLKNPHLKTVFEHPFFSPRQVP